MIKFFIIKFLNIFVILEDKAINSRESKLIKMTDIDWIKTITSLSKIQKCLQEYNKTAFQII